MRKRPAWPALQPTPAPGSRSPAERDRAIVAACRTAMQLLEGSPDRAARMAHSDPVPASTRAHIRRLIAAAHA